MKKFLIAVWFCTVICLTAVIAGAADTLTKNGVIYELYSSTLLGNTAAVIGYDNDHIGESVSIPQSVISGGWTKYKVTNIRDDAFAACSQLTEVTVSDTVLAVGANAFPSGVLIRCTAENKENAVVQWAVGNGNRYSVTVPDSAAEIAACAFSDCAGLVEVKLPDAVQKIGQYAFDGCTGLRAVDLPDSITEIGVYAFSGCAGLKSAKLPQGITLIGEGLFKECASLEAVTFPATVYRIEEEAFSGCAALSVPALPASVTEIGNYAFAGCSRLNTALPSGLKRLGEGAFMDCALTKINVPDGITFIREKTFFSCNAVTDITVPDGLAFVEDDAFDIHTPYAVTVHVRAGTDGFSQMNKHFSVFCSPSEPDWLWTEAEEGKLKLLSYIGTGENFSIPDQIDGVEIASLDGNAFYGCGPIWVRGDSAYARRLSDTGFNKCESPDEPGWLWYLADGEAVITAYVGTDPAPVQPASINGVPVRGYHPETPEWLWEEKNGEITVTGYSGTEASLVIPATVNGLPVTAIGNYAFMGRTGLTDVTLPDTLKSVGAGAFQLCSGLSEAVLSCGTVNIPADAFPPETSVRKLHQLTEVAAKEPTCETDGNAACWSCGRCGGYFSDPDGATELPDENRILPKKPHTEEILPMVAPTETATGLSEGKRCSVCGLILTEQTVIPKLDPATSGQIGTLTWFFSDGLLGITGDGELPRMTEYPWSSRGDTVREVQISSGAVNIPDGAFSSLTGLEHVSIPETVTRIGSRAFDGCALLTEIRIPAGVTAIADDAFAGAPNIVIDAEPGSAAAEYAKARGIRIREIRLTSVTLSDSSRTVYLSKGKTVTAELAVTAFLPANATDPSVTWTSSDPAVAAVDETGLVTANAAGGAVITATAKDGSGVSASCTVTVKKTLITALSLPKDRFPEKATEKVLVLKKGKTYTLKPETEPADHLYDQKLTFKSSKKSVVKVSSSGKITALKKGTATVTVTAKDGGGAKLTLKVIVGTPVSKVSLNKSTVILKKGKTLTLKSTLSPEKPSYGKVVWTSSNPKIATVSASGKITAKKNGTCVITCMAADGSGVKAACTVHVGTAITKLTLNKTKLSLKKGRSETLKVTFTPSKASFRTVTWTSSDPKIATVDENGKVRAKKKGTCTVTCKATDGSGVKVSCRVTVK